MKKQILFIGLILTLLLILTACGGVPANEIPKKTYTPGVENEVKVKEPEVVEEEVDDSFVDNISDDFYYETEIIVDGLSYFEKYWYSGNMSRHEVVGSEYQENLINIGDKEKKIISLYEPEDNSVMIIEYDPSSNAFDDSRGSDYMDQLIGLFDDDGKVKVEKGSLDGQKVQIITGNIFGKRNTMWISTKIRHPLKNEQYDEDGEVEVLTLFRNFSTEPIDQSVFVIPEGVEVFYD